jgi:hypothetical protein
MEKTKTKTIEKVNAVYINLNNNFRNKTFKYNDIATFLFDKDIHGMTFYYFVYAKVINKISRGEYKINDSFYKTKPSTIYKLGKEHLEILRKKRFLTLKENSNKDNFEKKHYQLNFNLKENEAIKFLKGLGYKIMKPIQQFEEI